MKTTNKPVWNVTFYGFRQEVCSWFGLFDPVAFHSLALLIQAQEPGPARFLLPVQHGAVDDVVVLKHRLFKLALCCKQLLQTQRHKRSTFDKFHQTGQPDACGRSISTETGRVSS